MRFAARRGRLRLQLAAGEGALLASLLEELDAVLDGPPDHDDPVVARLYPDAHPDDPAASRDYRELTESTLHGERNERVAACRAELAWAVDGQDGEVELTDPDVSRRWLQVLNDLRLAIGTRIGITAEPDNRDDPDPTDPEQQPKLIYHWLTSMQDSLVDAVMR